MQAAKEINRCLWGQAEPYIKDGEFGTPLQVWAQEFRFWFNARLQREFESAGLLPAPAKVRRAIHPGRPQSDEYWMNAVGTKQTEHIEFQVGINCHWPSVQRLECRFDVTPFESFDPMV